MDAIQNQHIVNVDLNSEMKKAYIDYAMSVIVSRALPDVRDGMKPVHRRILYDMYESNLLYENDFKKSAATVGDVLGKYHPHGDTSVYDAMVRMAQDFSLRYPLVQGKGNFGSVDGDPAAAYRYTEAKMSQISALMLTDIEKDTVDFVPNYDDKLKEPDVLPSRFPNLLVNGSSGIAVGMATNIPPHNLNEVVNGIIAVIDDPMITTEELMTYIQGPDFPTGGVIMGKSGIRNAYTTGRGRVILRAKAEIEEHNGKHRIIVSEIPYQVNKARLEKHINELVRDGKIDGISSTRDESTEIIRLVIDLKRDANPNVVLNNLYKFTQMQDTFGIILIALVDKEPKVLTLREMIDYYIAHQEDVITRRTQFELQKALDRAHILEGYKIVIDNVDEVIRIIRAAKNIPDAKAALCERFGLSDAQADAIVKMQLGRLSGMEREKIEEEYAEICAKIEDYRDILANESRVLEIVKEDLVKIRDKYGDERRTEISMVTNEIDIDDLIDEEDIVVTMTHNGYTKRQPVDTYKSQRRGGRGISGMTTREEDFVEHLFTTTTHHNLLFFTTKGIVYKLKGYQIPEASRQAKGMAIVNLLPIETDEKVTAMIAIKDFEDGKYLTFITRNGVVKKTPLMDYAKIRNSGLRAINIDEDDELIRVKLTDNEQDLILGTHNGYAIRFSVSEVRQTGRTTRGVKGIDLRDGDYVIGASTALPETQLLTVTENGYGKKTPLDEYRIQSRGGKGIFTYKITDKTGRLAGMKTVTDGDDIILITSDGVIIRMHTDEISSYSRQTQGVRVMKLADDVNVVSIARTEREEESEEEEQTSEQTENQAEGEVE
ncbi:MAG: DNA gyrase subunit A [Clostridia bacterium]|nr:DNA gyrase subunit A [Clostridia bacterium]NDO19109.1 DNA gyrase subunit A [Lachnospiraceae bacterium MD329]